MARIRKRKYKNKILNVEVVREKDNNKGFFIKLKNYFKNIPLDFLLIIGLFAYLVIPPNKTLNSCVILFISAYIAYIISKLVLKIKQSIQDSFNDKEKFKMYMQLTNKILLTIITLVGSILTILLTIKQLLS